MNLVTASIVVAVLAVCAATAELYDNKLAEEMYQSAAMEGFMKIMRAYLKVTERVNIEDDGPVVSTTHGKVRGLSLNGAQVFKKIEFARAGRWEDPQTNFQYDQEITDATEEPPMCPQKLSYEFPTPASRKPYIHIPMSEDCLYLNVFTPKADSSTNLPVMVFIYGGAFIAGYSDFDFYDSTHLVKDRGVIVVTFNYRLGALGFLKYGGVLHGNYGYLDQLAALEWVRDNIRYFGGDPSQVTLWGESAGAMSVAYHLTRPESKPLFNKAIMESDPFGFAFKLSEDAENRGNAFAKHLGCNSVEELRKVDNKTIVDEQLYEEALMAKAIKNLNIFYDKPAFSEFLQWTPIVENEDEQPITMMANKKMHPYPIIMGTMSNEGRLFIYGVMKKPIPFVWPFKRTTLGIMVGFLFKFGYFNRKRRLIVDEYTKVEAFQDHDVRPVLSELISDFVFICPVQYGAQEAKEHNKLYLFDFNHHPSWVHAAGCDGDNVCHGNEIPFVFGTVGLFNATEEEIALSRQMTLMWTNFAKTGDPNSIKGDSIDWPIVTDQQQTFIFDVGKDGVLLNYQAGKCDVWNDKLGMHVFP